MSEPARAVFGAMPGLGTKGPPCGAVFRDA